MKIFSLYMLTSLLSSSCTVSGFAPTARSATKSNIIVQQSSKTGDDAIEGDASLQDRRSALSSVVGMGLSMAGLATMKSSPAEAAVSTKKKATAPRTYFKGKITLKDDEATKAVLGNYKALFVSARPKNPATIPPEVVRSARGGVPAVFFAVIPNPTFPAQFTLTENDITPEGDFGLTSDPYWWSEDAEWEISVRADSDGVVRTLDSADLVGRSVTSQSGEGSPDADVCIAVKERGFFGSYYQRKEN